MNKAELIDALAERLGDRKVAAAAVAGLIEVVVRTVNAGDRVTITGFGVFEKRARAARTARNPRTGQAVTVQQTDVPVFRPGTLFREVVSGTRTLPAAGVRSTTVTARPVAASPAQSVSSLINPPARADSRLAAATRLSAVQVVPTKAPKTANVTDAAKASKSAKSATKAEKATAKAMKGKKGEPKNADKAPTKITAKKAVKKSAGKKSAVK